ncbi:integral membrane protein DUF92-domain-containing protein [Endogone sp. FLAS-F59071]|nr:integral membrane protein DUF92-domain-containing protein [Endogone sp. FLAS-F59071]|eukprot:RUS14054.1 integral membrane protein DUF92-domain-containing protein [Endogone sp. FLAS-F59071]
MHVFLALAFSVAFVVYTLRKKSLSTSGAAAAFCLAMLTFSTHLWAFTFKADRKRQLEDGYVESGQRDMWQVLSNSLTAAIALIIYRAWFGNGELACFEDERAARALVWAYVGHYAACNGDTWSSELGILNSGNPYLITTLRRVPPGTNGGVSPLGLAASLAGGLVIGLSGAAVLAIETACSGFSWGIVAVGVTSGVGGSLLDSLLGATVEQSLYSPNSGKIISSHSTPQGKVEVVSGMNLLSGNQINLVSSFVTAIVAGAVAWWTF